jgi:hypothetical protein
MRERLEVMAAPPRLAQTLAVHLIVGQRLQPMPGVYRTPDRNVHFLDSPYDSSGIP